MSNILKLTGSAFMAILLLAACGGNSGEKGSLADKKATLQKLKGDQTKLNEQIKQLEDEIGKLDTTTIVATKTVSVTTLSQQSFTHYIDLRGKVDAEDVSYVSPRGMGGQVKSIHVKLGDVVKKGQLLLTLDAALAQQQVSAAEQGANTVRSQLNVAKDIYNRKKNLLDQGIGTQVDVINTKGQVDYLEGQLSTALENVRMAKEQLSQTQVYADVYGVVDQLNLKVGELFAPATASLGGGQIRIVNTSRLKAVVEVPENYLASVQKGTPVVIEVTDLGKTFNSTISFVGQSVNANSRAITAEAKIPQDATLKPNLLATVKIRDYNVSNTIVIPMITLQNDEKGKFVYVLTTENGKSIARKRVVTVGSIYGEQIEVKSGLQAGDKLITQGFQSVYDGQPVIVE